MKKMRMIIPMVLILALAFVSCQKIRHQYLQRVDKDIVPYQMGESYRFVDGQGDTVALRVNGIEDKWNTDLGGFMVDIWVQYRKFSMSSASGDFRFVIVACGHEYGGSPNERTLSVSVWPSGLGTMIEYNRSGRFIKATGSYYGDQQVYDSLLLGDQMYYNVAERVKPDSYKVYYNKAYGVLQVQTNDKIIL
ncbi:MAG: hypothetical protein K2L50_03195, partial [Bacteroidales bacterium]|nr:hypothetical protein [Bacteroidales bacterium]